jgi:hypothetical protein
MNDIKMHNINDIVAWAAEMQEKGRQRLGDGERRQNLPLPTSGAMQLPLWPDVVRGVPNGVLRSALFSAIGKGRRRYMKEEQIAALDGIEIRYTGERLDQGDLDVWENALHISRLQAMGEQCRFTAYSMLKLMGKTDSGSNRETLHTRLIRLKANAVEIQQGRYSYAGSLIDDVYRDNETREYVLILNPKLYPLFAADQFTQIDWNVRHALNGKPLAQWLHGHYASHAKPYPIKIETLHQLCGSEAKRISDYKIDLRRNLEAVAEASEANDQPFSYEIKAGLVHVEKQGSGPQRRHVANKSVKSRRVS